jgi:hypothetical protein
VPHISVDQTNIERHEDVRHARRSSALGPAATRPQITTMSDLERFDPVTQTRGPEQNRHYVGDRVRRLTGCRHMADIDKPQDE